MSLEHPADPGHEPYPSLFHSDEFRYLCAACVMLYSTLDQCRYGGETKKPTGLAISNYEQQAQRFHLRCNHRSKHKSVIGPSADGSGKFATAILARYPSGLNEALAQCHVAQ